MPDWSLQRPLNATCLCVHTKLYATNIRGSHKRADMQGSLPSLSREGSSAATRPRFGARSGVLVPERVPSHSAARLADLPAPDHHPGPGGDSLRTRRLVAHCHEPRHADDCCHAQLRLEQHLPHGQYAETIQNPPSVQKNQAVGVKLIIVLSRSGRMQGVGVPNSVRNGLRD